ncbi:hypothetical protein SOM11_07080 [Frigoribacterium sp. CFBP9039]|uniref:hypothetical protein n=1 Tax=Frigoribacterium sp. CFBP9029 TaxID=3096541 RepID=UPI002A6B3469|nr:hypothetical protein [Frigoribacterium sp. CFBP9039]MDY0945749.1 hypothetical protein [Frigoribacterium sp. CFBP9039]
MRFAATTVLAVVAAMFLSGALALQTLAAYESYGSSAAGPTFVIGGLPAGPNADESAARISSIAQRLDVDVLLTAADPQNPDTTTRLISFRGTVELPVTPWLRYTIEPVTDAAPSDLRGYYTTSATGPLYDRLLDELSAAGFETQRVHISLASSLAFVTSTSSALLLLGTTLAILVSTALHENARRSKADALRVLTGWTALRIRQRRLVEIATMTAVIVAIHVVVAICAWGFIGRFRSPEVVLPLIAGALVPTGFVIVVHALVSAAPTPGRVFEARSGGASRRTEQIAPLGLRLAAVALLTVALSVGATAQATSLRIESWARSHLDTADRFGMGVGVAGVTEPAFDDALGPLAREELAAGRATLSDAGMLPAVLITLSDPPSTLTSAGHSTHVVSLETGAEETDAAAIQAAFDETLAPSWTVAGDAPPPYIHARATVSSAPTVAERAAVPLDDGELPLEAVLTVPLDLLPDTMLAISAMNGYVLFDDPSEIESRLHDAGAGGLITAWQRSGDEFAQASKEAAADGRLALTAAAGSLATVLTGVAASASAFCRRRMNEVRVLKLSGRRPWMIDLPFTASTTLATAGVATLAGLVFPSVTPGITGLIIAAVVIVDLATTTTTIALTRGRTWSRVLRRSREKLVL